jgi:DNA repair exonuclease SbcCD ATPase subunit
MGKYTSLLSIEALESCDFIEDKTAKGLQVLDFSISERTNLFETGRTFHQIMKGYKEEKDTLKNAYTTKEKILLKEYSHFYEGYRKAYEQLKVERESLNTSKFEYENKLKEEKALLVLSQRYWEDEQKRHQERVQKEENDIAAQLSTLNWEIVDLKKEKVEALKILEKNRYDSKEAIKQAQKELDEKNDKLKIAYEKSIQKEEKRYQNLLKDSGLDVKEIAQYTEESKAIKKKIDQIDNYRVSIEEYQKFLEDEWKEISNLKLAYKKEQNVYEAIESEVEELLKNIEKKQRHLEAELESLKSLLKTIAKQKIKLDDKLSESWERVESLTPLVAKSKEEKEQVDIENDADRILSKFSKAIQTYHTEKEALEHIMQQRWATFIAQGIINFSTDRIENAHRIVQADNADEIGKQIDKAFLQIKLSIDAIANYYVQLQDGYKEVKNAIHKVNRDLEDISSTSLIESIELRTQDKINGIDEEMKKLTNYWEEHQSNMQKTLFSTKYNSKHKNEILDRLKSFLEKLESLSKKEKELSVGSLFTLQGRVVEKGNDSQWQDNIFDAGSEGTRLLIKVAFIASLFSMALHGSKDKQIPYIVIDEIGKLHNNNVEKVLKYINKKGSYLVAVQPNSAMARFFDKAYLLDDVTPQETRIIEYIRKKKAIKLKGEESESFTS